jgi:hypothetical protein
MSPCQAILHSQSLGNASLVTAERDGYGDCQSFVFSRRLTIMKANYALMIASIALTAASWGVYGPVLHWGQTAMGGGRFRPFMCVGIAYFALAVVIPVMLLSLQGFESEEKYRWTLKGVFWSLAAGSAGAVGALGIIFAFANAGPPATSKAAIFVMPLVFGCAPVVNTLFMVTIYNLWGKINPFFAAGLILTASGAFMVLLNAPKPEKPASAKPVPSSSAVAEVAAQDPPADDASQKTPAPDPQDSPT